MKRAYVEGAGDPYLAFAKMAKALPPRQQNNLIPGSQGFVQAMLFRDSIFNGGTRSGASDR